MIWRIRRRATFAELARGGHRVGHGGVRMTYCPQPEPHPLVAFAFGRRFGTAVERNRARRRLRAAFERSWEARPGPPGAYLLTARRGVLTADFDRLVSAVDRCLASLPMPDSHPDPAPVAP